MVEYNSSNEVGDTAGFTICLVCAQILRIWALVIIELGSILRKCQVC